MPDCKNLFENLFKKTCSYKNASVIVQAAPWEVTSSYGGGSSLGPQNIVRASSQLDFFNFTTKSEPDNFIYMHKIDKNILSLNNKLQKNAQKIMQACESAGDKQIDSVLKDLQQKINQESDNLNNTIYKNTIKVLKDKKIPALLGGDHSVSFGAIKACLAKHKNLSILHIDAHADLRKAYQGFKHSHASIMY
ncbi:MAG: agmatinase, partial [Bdellovibrionales bacterium]|nr:agmatinase [Bdellovibrionales bacterium]